MPVTTMEAINPPPAKVAFATATAAPFPAEAATEASASAAPAPEAPVATPAPVIPRYMTKPKRPLSAFNLFYRFKRQIVLNAISSGLGDKDDIVRLVTCSPGLEHATPDDIAAKMAEAAPKPDSEEGERRQTLTPLQALRNSGIRADLKNNLLPRDTRDRAHRTNSSAMNGAMSFLELGKLMNSSWKEVDAFAKEVFNDLAEEGRAHYRDRMRVYNVANEGNKGQVRQANGEVVEVPIVDMRIKPLAAASKGAAKKKSKKKSPPPAPSIKSGGSSEGSATETREDESGSKKMARKRRKRSSSPSSIHRNGAPLSLPVVHHGMNSANEAAMRTAHAGLMRTNSNASSDGLRTVSADYSQDQAQGGTGAPQGRPQGQVGSSSNNTIDQAALHARVKELEGQLANERLLAQVRELEGDLARAKNVEGQLRAQLDVFARFGRSLPPMSRGITQSMNPGMAGTMAPPSMNGPLQNGAPHHGAAHPSIPGSMQGSMPPHPSNPSSMHQDGGPGGGLWSLVNASMIHPSVQTNERANMLRSRTITARNAGAHPGAHHSLAPQLPPPHQFRMAHNPSVPLPRADVPQQGPNMTFKQQHSGGGVTAAVPEMESQTKKQRRK